MGRYYHGQIEGKFWFGVQSSTDASFFGGTECEPNYINYYFSKERDLERIEAGIERCKEELGEYKQKLDEFFAKNDGYNDEMIAKEFDIPEEKVKPLLEWYARLELGENILNCVQEKGECSFEAEL